MCFKPGVAPRFIENGIPPVTRGILIIVGLETFPLRTFQDKALAGNTRLFLDGILLLYYYVDEAI